MKVILPSYRSEIPYVLREHRKLDASERPTWWYKKLDLDEMADLMDSAASSFRSKGSDEIEDRMFTGRIVKRVLYQHLLRVENMFNEDGSPVAIPPPNPNGGLTAERREAINRLPRPWQIELVNAITEDRTADQEALEKN